MRKCRICGEPMHYQLYDGKQYCSKHYKEAMLSDFEETYENWNGEGSPNGRLLYLLERLIYEEYVSWTGVHLPPKFIKTSAYNFVKLPDNQFSFVIEVDNYNEILDIKEKWIVDISNRKVTGNSNYFEKSDELQKRNEEEVKREREKKAKERKFLDSLDFKNYPIFELTRQLSGDSDYTEIKNNWNTYYDKKENKVIKHYEDIATYRFDVGGDVDEEEWEQQHKLIKNNPDRFIRVIPPDHGTWHGRFFSWLSENDLRDKYVNSIGKTLEKLPNKKRSEWLTRRDEHAEYDAKRFIVKQHPDEFPDYDFG